MKIDNGPRERLEKYGINSLSDDDLLAIILKTGTKDKDVFQISKDILKEILNIKMLSDYSYKELMEFSGIGKAKAMTIVCALELGKRIDRINKRIIKIRSPKDIYNLFIDDLKGLSNECLGIVYLNSNMGVIYKEIETINSFDSVYVSNRDIIKKAIRLNSRYIGLIHNHPSGMERPSEEDYLVKDKLEILLNEFEIGLYDSIVITSRSYFSMTYSDKPIYFEE